MQAQSRRPVRTFSIGFHEDGFDEARMAKDVARHLGTDHADLYVTGVDARAVIPRLPELCDEPFADASEIPTFLVAQLARQHVTVSLSGDGGDELFGGYTRYALAEAAWRVVSKIPRTLRGPLAAGVRDLPLGSALRALGPLLPAKVSRLDSRARRQQIADLLASRDRTDLYRRMISVWQRPVDLVRGGTESFASEVPSLELGSFSKEMSYTDLVGYLPDDILVKVDRASMAVSLEARVPMLDHRLVELAASLPEDLRVREGKRKWILRQVLYRYVPPSLVERPKMGFAVPMGAWLRGPLREWAQDLLSSARVRAEHLVAAAPLSALLDAHLAEKEDAHAPLWLALVFLSWQEAQSRTS
jgi:asparagine synthase (glutamine-hydrolysing)